MWSVMVIGNPLEKKMCLKVENSRKENRGDLPMKHSHYSDRQIMDIL